jgi:curved DNA-binding protein CbpA
MKRDWQAVLELRELLQPKRDDIERAYRRLAMERHPDKGGSDAAMAELNAARDEALQELGDA